MNGRTLRAFVWLRWRVLVNSLERTGSRDVIERFSIALEKLGPIMALVLLIPSALGLAALATIAGFGLATDSWNVPFEIVRFFLLASVCFAVIGPVVLPMRDTANTVRLLLLPISRTTLYVGHLSGTLADPWILLVVPVTIGVGVGMAIGAHFVGALLAIAAGIALLVFLAGLTSLSSSVIHLLLRNRRRADIVMLLLVLGLPVIGFVPSMLQIEDANRRVRTIPGEPAEEQRMSSTEQLARRAFVYVPSEIYKRTVENGATRPSAATVPLVVLIGLAMALQAGGIAAFSRVLDQPQSIGVRRAGAFGGLWSLRIPGMSPAESAGAMAQGRLALRTTRGRSSLASPLLLFLIFGAGFVRRHGAFGGLPTRSGEMLCAFCMFISLFAILPLGANQFAIDGAGLTRELLLPITTRELVTGKAVGNLLVSLVPATIIFLMTPVVLGVGNEMVWLAIPPGYVAAYALVAPVLAAVSALFPRKVDLSRIGQGSNPHQGASFISLIASLAAGAPSVLLVLLALHWWRRPALAPLLVLAWCAVSLAIAHVLFVPVRRLVASRTETLAHST